MRSLPICGLLLLSASEGTLEETWGFGSIFFSQRGCAGAMPHHLFTGFGEHACPLPLAMRAAAQTACMRRFSLHSRVVACNALHSQADWPLHKGACAQLRNLAKQGVEWEGDIKSGEGAGDGCWHALGTSYPHRIDAMKPALLWL